MLTVICASCYAADEVTCLCQTQIKTTCCQWPPSLIMVLVVRWQLRKMTHQSLLMIRGGEYCTLDTVVDRDDLTLCASSLPVDTVWAMVIVWRIRGKIVRAVLCFIVYCSGAHCMVMCTHTHTYELFWTEINEKLAATLRGSRPGVQSASLIMTSLMTS